jgi:GntR family histidine utilization transcriptional repressor
MLEIQDLAEEARRAGRDYRHSVIERAAGPASVTERQRLGLPDGTRLLRLATLHLTDGVPDAVERRVINLAAVPNAEAEDFAGAPPGTWLLRQVAWTAAEHAIRAVAADKELARRLGVGAGSALLGAGAPDLARRPPRHRGDHRLSGRPPPHGGTLRAARAADQAR